jgi:hypothetical protein
MIDIENQWIFLSDTGTCVVSSQADCARIFDVGLYV